MSEEKREAGTIYPISRTGHVKSAGEMQREKNLVQNRPGYVAPRGDAIRERTSKGGKASAKARRERKALRDLMEEILDMPLMPGPVEGIEDIGSVQELLERQPNLTIAEQLVIVVTMKAMTGDIRAYEIIMDILGEPRRDTVLDVTPQPTPEEKARDEALYKAFLAFLDEHPEYGIRGFQRRDFWKENTRSKAKSSETVFQASRIRLKF